LGFEARVSPSPGWSWIGSWGEMKSSRSNGSSGSSAWEMGSAASGLISWLSGGRISSRRKASCFEARVSLSPEWSWIGHWGERRSSRSNGSSGSSAWEMGSAASGLISWLSGGRISSRRKASSSGSSREGSWIWEDCSSEF